MSLKEYTRKRDFKKTPEPAGKVHARQGNSFVIQKHAASRLHYDFRLEMEGVLRSWAVPKGPSLDPAEKRLAVHVEDHPLEYGGFEGIIPKGEYGGGTVLLWDNGTWEPEGDPVAAYRKGHIKFTLAGKKLHGGWHLVRLHGDRAGKDGENWLLFKVDDEAAIPGSGDRVTEELTDSVESGRSMDEIAAAADRVWNGGPVEGDEKKAKGGKTGKDRKAETSAPPRLLPVRADAATADTFAGVRLTHPDRVLFAEQGITKRDLAAYYERIADWILPYLADRPLTLVRCPEGKMKECFYQKHVTVQFPESVHRVEIEEESKTVTYGTIDSPQGLLSLVQMGVLEFHIWGAHVDDVEKPDYAVFDLDPDEGLPWERVATGATTLRLALEHLGLRSFLKTTGGKGLHVCLPLERRTGWDEVKAFTKAVAEVLAAFDPKSYTTKPAKASRKGKIFIDYLRNGRGATSVCAYSTRARAGAPVSTPLFWEELDGDVRANTFTVENLSDRLDSLDGDPWADFSKIRQSITAAMKKAVGL